MSIVYKVIVDEEGRKRDVTAHLLENKMWYSVYDCFACVGAENDTYLVSSFEGDFVQIKGQIYLQEKEMAKLLAKTSFPLGQLTNPNPHFQPTLLFTRPEAVDSVKKRMDLLEKDIQTKIQEEHKKEMQINFIDLDEYPDEEDMSNEKSLEKTNEKGLEKTNEKGLEKTNEKVLEEGNEEKKFNFIDLDEYPDEEKMSNNMVLEKGLEKDNEKVLEKDNEKVLEKDNEKVLEKDNEKVLEKDNEKVLEKDNEKVLVEGKIRTVKRKLSFNEKDSETDKQKIIRLERQLRLAEEHCEGAFEEVSSLEHELDLTRDAEEVKIKLWKIKCKKLQENNEQLKKENHQLEQRNKHLEQMLKKFKCNAKRVLNTLQINSNKI